MTAPPERDVRERERAETEGRVPCLAAECPRRSRHHSPSRPAGRPQSGALPRPVRGGETATRSNPTAEGDDASSSARAVRRVHGAPLGGVSRPPAPKKSPTCTVARQGVSPASPELAGFLSGFSVSNRLIESPSWSLTTKSTTLDGGSLGSWVDEDRSKMRVVV